MRMRAYAVRRSSRRISSLTCGNAPVNSGMPRADLRIMAHPGDRDER